MSKEKRAYKAHNYSNSDLDRALEAVREGISIGKAAKEYGIPKSTLHAKAIGKVPEMTKKGPSPILTSEEENRLKKWILDKARLGFPMHPDEVKNAVQRVLKEAPRENPFTDDRPGDKWLKLFLLRHPQISIKQAEVISKGRASVTEENLRHWFRGVISHLEDIGAASLLARSESIFNGDETGMELCPKSGRLMGEKGGKDLYEIAPGKEKESITVLGTFSAAGVALPPMILFPYKRIPLHLSQSVPDDWPIGRSDSGWMVSQTFFEYIANHFYPWCIKNNVEFPVIYFLDGHKSHLSLELSDFCVQHGIILYCLYPSSTHIIQPCDVAIFRGLKYKWKKVVQQYKQTTQKSITKLTFAPLFKEAFDQISEDSIKNGFKICGLYPFNENAVNYDKCISTRRKGLNQDAVDDGTTHNEESPLTHNDFLTTAKFFRHILGKEKIQEFTNQRSSNEPSHDPNYLLWKTCMDKIEGYSGENELGHNNKTNTVELDETQVLVPPSQSTLRFGNDAGASDKELHEAEASSGASYHSPGSNNPTCDEQPVIDGQSHLSRPSSPQNVTPSSFQGVMNSPVQTEDHVFSNLMNFLRDDPSTSQKIEFLELDDTIILELDESTASLVNCGEFINLTNVSEPDTSLSAAKTATASKDNKNTLDIVKVAKGIDINTTLADSKHGVHDSNPKEMKNTDSELLASADVKLKRGAVRDKLSSSVVTEISSLEDQSSASQKNNNISEIWNRNLLWPSTEGLLKKSGKKVQNQSKSDQPYALTSAEWRNRQIQLKEEKEKKEAEVKMRAQARLIKKKEEEERKAEAKMEREKKRAEKLRIKEENAAAKISIKQEKLKLKLETETQAMPVKKSTRGRKKTVQKELSPKKDSTPEA